MGGLYLFLSFSIGAASLHYGTKLAEAVKQHYELSQVCEELVSPLPKKPAFVIVESKPVETPVKTVSEACTTEKCRATEYFKEKFGDRAEDGLKMLETCENRSLSTSVVSPMNIQQSGRKSYDVGFMQINVDANNTKEIEKLKDYKYNIDQGHRKFVAKNNTFYAWTCGHVIGDATYADNY